MENMNRSMFALFVALLIHLLFLLLFWFLLTMTPKVDENIQKEDKKIKISLKEMPIKHKESGLTKQKIKPSPIAPPMPKGSQLKEIVKKPLIKYTPPKQQIKQPQINTKPKEEPKPKPKPKVKHIESEKSYVVLQKDLNITKKEKQKTKKTPNDALYALLSQDKSSQEEEQKANKKVSDTSSITQNIKELYGEEFGKLSQGQQQYILDNQEIMRRITQQVLTRVARVNLPRDLNVNKTNVVEFYLHPNGDMSDFKFLHKSGYYILDDTTKETMEYAYSKYPRPSEKTLIRYNVFYNLAHY